MPAGQTYYLVCDYYYDDYYGDQGGGYGTWTGTLSTNQYYVWWYQGPSSLTDEPGPVSRNGRRAGPGRFLPFARRARYTM